MRDQILFMHVSRELPKLYILENKRLFLNNIHLFYIGSIVDDSPLNRQLAVLQLMYFLRHIPPFSGAIKHLQASVAFIKGK